MMSKRELKKCAVCGISVRDVYQIMDDVWAAAGFGKNDEVHIDCLIQTLGRPLVYNDFTRGPVNEIWTCKMKLPCEFCLFEELKFRYAHCYRYKETLVKLEMVNPPQRYKGDYKKMVIDRCTCNEL